MANDLRVGDRVALIRPETDGQLLYRGTVLELIPPIRALVRLEIQEEPFVFLTENLVCLEFQRSALSKSVGTIGILSNDRRTRIFLQPKQR